MCTEKKYAINLTLFKIIGFYQMVDPNSVTLFGYNIHNCSHIICVIFTSIMTLIGLSGFFFKNEGPIEFGFKDMQMLFYLACITVGNIKLIIIISNTKKLWTLFNVTHKSFLSSKCCKNNHFKIVNCGKQFGRMFYWYFFLFFWTAVSWTILPKTSEYYNANEKTNTDQNTRRYNVVNLRYPISVKTYNNYYNIIYVMETLMCSYSAYGLVTFDLFLIALLQLISTQYEIVSSAYEDLEFRVKDKEGCKTIRNEKIKDDFISITKDSQNIYKHLKIIYRISRPIVLIYMVGDSVGMITLPYSIVMCFVQNGSSINSEVLIFSWTLFVVGVQSFMFSSLFQHINERKEAVRFGIYSCDWTWSDIQFKKLLLLTLKMNGSNNLKMNATPTKYIDLPMLATIVRSSYSVTSVLINSNFHKLEKS